MKYFLSIFFICFCASSISAQYSLQAAFPNLPAFIQPTEMQIAPDGTDRIFIVQQKGLIYLFHNNPLASQRNVFLDLSGVVSQTGPGSETGLLGLAFHPDFKTNGYFYVNYTTGISPNVISHISRFQVSQSNPDTVLNSTEQIVLTLIQAPYPNHKGGHLVFGPDGYLYAAFGDGGSGGDPQNRAQNPDSLFGKILRLDVDHEANGLHYAIPSDNPFANNTNTFRKEIYAYGLRNVWKFSFDHVTGRLWAGDVGQALYEEIDTIQNGGNYGWNHMEGFHCYPSGNFSCDSTGFIPPLWEYPHIGANGNATGDIAITGGFVYRGTSIPSLIGKYIYGDYGSNRIWALTYDGINTATNKLLVDQSSPRLNLSSFGEDQNHEIYTVGYTDGKIYKLVSTEHPLAPVFINHVHGEIDTIDFSSNDTGYFGLRSITWNGSNGTDTSKFSVALDKPLLPCNSDYATHHIVIQQKDITIGGCLQFVFTDCGGLQSFDTLCFAKHLLIINPDTIDFGMVPRGTMASNNIGISIMPNDGAEFLVDTIIVRSTSANAFVIMPMSPVPFYAGAVTAIVEYFPHSFTRDTALVIFHTKNTSDSLYYLQLYGRGQFIGSVVPSSSKELSLVVSPNPFKERIHIQYSSSIFGNRTLSIFDILGQEVQQVINYTQEAGSYSLDFDGSKLPTGSYILRLESNGKVISRKIIKE